MVRIETEQAIEKFFSVARKSGKAKEEAAKNADAAKKAVDQCVSEIRAVFQNSRSYDLVKAKHPLFNTTMSSRSHDDVLKFVVMELKGRGYTLHPSSTVFDGSLKGFHLRLANGEHKENKSEQKERKS
jgi:hypothetical protein